MLLHLKSYYLVGQTVCFKAAAYLQNAWVYNLTII